MKYFVYFVSFLTSALFQTVINPHLPPQFVFYDPFIVMVLYFAGKERFYEGCIFSILAGLLMDGVSGGGIGFFFASYIWFFFIARWIGMYLRFGNGVIIVLTSIIGVLVQNFVFFLPEIIRENRFLPSDFNLQFIRAQLVWAVFTSYGLYSLFSGAMDRFAGRSRTLFGSRRELDNQELIRG